MSVLKIKDNFFRGGVMIAIHLKIFQIEGESINDENLIAFLKKSSGAFQIGYDTRFDYYGPYQFSFFNQSDFYKEDQRTLTEVIKGFEKQIPDLYFGDEVPETNTFTDTLNGMIPLDILNEGSVHIFKWNYGKDSDKAGISTDVIGYDYFFSVFASKDSKICLITIWFD